jgi:hypothetical protein
MVRVTAILADGLLNIGNVLKYSSVQKNGRPIPTVKNLAEPKLAVHQHFNPGPIRDHV